MVYFLKGLIAYKIFIIFVIVRSPTIAASLYMNYYSGLSVTIENVTMCNYRIVGIAGGMDINIYCPSPQKGQTVTIRSLHTRISTIYIANTCTENVMDVKPEDSQCMDLVPCTGDGLDPVLVYLVLK